MAEASAPASSANLGPGFDTLALALDIRCRVRAEPSDTWAVDHLGPHALKPGVEDAVLAAARRAVGPETPLRLVVENEIPVARGLGSSAAAAAAGVLAAWRATSLDRSRNQLFGLVAELEGHPDNAAAAVFGGLQLVTTAGEARSLSIHPELLPIVAVPATELLTSEARSILPESMTRAGVVRSLQRVVALTEGLRTADPGLLDAASGDEIHEQQRSPLNPLASELITASRSAGALFSCWSGAGPSVLAFTEERNRPAVIAALQAVFSDRGVVISPGVDQRGAE
jgi:homoserine kinase